MEPLRPLTYHLKFITLRFLAIELPTLWRSVTHHEKQTMHHPNRRRDPVQVLGDPGEQTPEVQRPPEG